MKKTFSTEKKARAPDMTKERIELVIEIVDGWKGKLTWDLLIEGVSQAIGITYSRFTLAEYPSIANAFSLRKQALKGAIPRNPRDALVKAALEKTDRYRAKAERLEQENQLLLEQFVTWAANAERKGVTMSMLNAPLPKPNRDRSKGVE
jgi:hypothetical protein